MSITLKLERPVARFLRHSFRALSRVSATVKDDPYSKFAIKQKAVTIHKLLGLKLTRARILLKQDRSLAQKPLAHYIKISEVVEPFQPIPSCPLDEGKNLILSSPIIVRRNCDFLQECGARKATAEVIAGCQNYMAVPIGVFKSYTDVDPTFNIEDNWLSLFPQPFIKEAKKCLEKFSSVTSSIAHKRNVVIASYLAQKWNLPFEDIFQWVEEGIKFLPISVNRLVQVVKVLEECGFDQSAMWRYPKLLQSDPDSLKLFVKTYKNDFLGITATEFLLSDDHVTCQMDFATLHANVEALLKFGVPPLCIRNNLKSLLTHDSVMLEEKLRQIALYPELSVFAHHPRFAKLFDDVDTVVLRVKTFRAIDKRQITFTACTCTAKEFSAIIQLQAKLCLSDEALGYLANQCRRTKAQVRVALQSHPYSKELSSENMKQVVELITSKGFTREQLCNGLHLVLYPVDMVAQKLAELSSRPDMQPIQKTLREPNVLQIVLYLLEEQFMFTGNGVFAKSPNNPDHQSTSGKDKPKDK